MVPPTLNRVLLLVVVSAIPFSHCRNIEKKAANNIVAQDSIETHRGGHFILDPTCDTNRKIISRPEAIDSKIEVDYYPNGKIHKWKEYFGDKYPQCIIYYDTNGVFDTFAGNPFLKYGEKYLSDGVKFLGIATINPPYIPYFVVLMDSDKTKPKSKPVFLKYAADDFDYHVPTKDTCSWFLIKNELLSKKDHYFKLQFYFIDSTLNIYRRSEKEMLINGLLYKIDSIPYRKYTFKELN